MIVLPMAGLSRRFFDAGYDRPKYELPLAGRPVLDWSLLSFARMFGQEDIVLVFRDLPGIAGFVEERLLACGVPRAYLVGLPAPTQGQAETVALGLEHRGVGDREPITIFNIDTFRPDLEIPASVVACDGYLETFLGTGTGWSFVEPVAVGSDRAQRVVEKVRISDYCCTGLYYFRAAADFERAYRAERMAPSSHELFVAPLYQHMIARGADIRFRVVAPDEVFFCGTPAEYRDMLSREAILRQAFAVYAGLAAVRSRGERRDEA